MFVTYGALNQRQISCLFKSLSRLQIKKASNLWCKCVQVSGVGGGGGGGGGAGSWGRGGGGGGWDGGGGWGWGGWEHPMVIGEFLLSRRVSNFESVSMSRRHRHQVMSVFCRL